jgi:TonB family protein
MQNDKKRSGKTIVLGASAFVAVLFIAVVVYGIKILISDDGQKRKRQIQMVTLVKPPPPPKIEEKPPEPEVKKKEEIIEPEPEPEPEEMNDTSQDDAPPGDELGLDADGAAGADGFGLKAKKGGRALIGGGLGNNSLLRKYAWYTRIIQEDLRKQIHDYMNQDGGIPSGNCRVMVKILLDSAGTIVDYTIVDPCGNPQMDNAVKKVLGMAKISEPPPADMPKTIKLKVSAKG